VWLDWSLTKERIGQQLKNHYRACTSVELPPRLLVLIKKLDEENEPSMEQSQTIRTEKVDFMNCAIMTGCAFRFLRQPSRPKPPMPVANSGSAAAMGI
jgi:hypothetical protein